MTWNDVFVIIGCVLLVIGCLVLGDLIKAFVVLIQEKSSVKKSELADALLTVLLDADHYFYLRPNSHRGEFEEFYEEEIEILEKQTGECWDEMRGKG